VDRSGELLVCRRLAGLVARQWWVAGGVHMIVVDGLFTTSIWRMQ